MDFDYGIKKIFPDVLNAVGVLGILKAAVWILKWQQNNQYTKKQQLICDSVCPKIETELLYEYAPLYANTSTG